MDTKVILVKQDLTYLNWTKTRNSSGTAGSFLKAYDDLGEKKLYYKLSNFNVVDGIIGHEAVNEIIVDRLLSYLNIDHLHYQLVHADVNIDNKVYDTYVCVSEDFKEKGESKLALDAYYDSLKDPTDTPLSFCKRMGWSRYIYTMLVVDFLILNRDRHGANIEVLRNKRKKNLRLAPLFDHGLSLLFNCMSEQSVQAFDVMEDKPVQCFVGGRSTYTNLELIPENELPRLKPLTEATKNMLFEDLGQILTESLQNKIWELLWRRWQYYENFCSTR